MRLLTSTLISATALALACTATAADETVVVLRGSSAPPEPWNTPATEEVVVREVVYVPVYYYPVLPYGVVRHRPFAHAAQVL